MPIERRVFPFSAIVGQERMRRALILNAVNPRIGGVLIRGERGTAKSTAARALAALLPEIAVVDGCRFNCDAQRPDTQPWTAVHGAAERLFDGGGIASSDRGQIRTISASVTSSGGFSS